MQDKFKKPYKPQENEDKIYKKWEDSGFFNPDKCIEAQVCEKEAESFSIVLPPPNVTGTLHMGHAAGTIIEDILIRYNRMKGKKTLWIPGTDHAAIATASKVEGQIYRKENKTRHDLGREEFLRRVEEFAKNSKHTIISQLKKLGASLDWSREAYTLDDERNLAVRTAFKNMYEDGLIYRGFRIVNWDPKMQTTVSDDEIVHKEQKTKLYYLKYGPFTIATARPETKFGDKYAVMHPNDKRYAEYKHGQKIDLEWINGYITATIIKDEAIDPEFGSGVMTITPWHDLTDFEIAERHNLEKEQIINYDGNLLPIAKEFSGMNIDEARPKIIEKLKEKDLLIDIDSEYIHNLATNERGGGIIEPQIKKQWFIDVNKNFKIKDSKIKGIKEDEEVNLKQLMRTVVENKQINILPEQFEKIFFHWIEKLGDWCISRQIWYGHRIPVWYKQDKVYCGIEAPKEEGWEQDPDTLDTWFSSGLWTFSTLGWPQKTEDLKIFHPTNILESGYDLIFFWIARMILMTTYNVGEIPFEKVYLHGMIRDEKGAKMSKSLGNTIDPIDMIEKYGADATRISLIIGSSLGQDISVSEEKIKAYKHFANKLWNISRFILSNTEDLDIQKTPEFTTENFEKITSFKKVLKEINENIETLRLHLAGEKLYHYIWHEFADIIIEENKSKLYSENVSEQEKTSIKWMLYTILTTSLKTLHPFMPFITEEIWSHLEKTKVENTEIKNSYKKRDSLMIEEWPIC